MSEAIAEEPPPSSMTSRTFVWLRRAWLALTCASGVLAVMLLDDGKNRDVDLILIWVMGIVCLPSSLLALVATGLLGQVAQAQLSSISRLAQMEIGWGVFFLFGVLQWYVLLPRLLQKRIKHECSHS